MADQKPNSDLVSELVNKVGQELFDEASAKLTGAAVPKITEIKSAIQMLIGNGEIDVLQPDKDLKKAFTAKLIKLILADRVLPGSTIAVVTAELFQRFRQICKTRVNATGDAAPNRPRLTAPGSGKQAVVHFVYELKDLPTVTDPATGKPVTDKEIEEIFLGAWDQWIGNSSKLKIVSAKDGGGITPNLTMKAIPIDGRSNTLALSTWGQGGINAGISQYDMLIDKSESWSADKFQAMLMHEVGHLLGLDDSKDDEVMNGTLSLPYKTKLAPSEIKKFHQLGWK